MSLDLGNITFWAGPDQLGAPDSLVEPIIAFIDDARATLDVAVQELESEQIARALIAAKQRGVRVRR